MKNFITQMQHQHEKNLQLASLAKDLVLFTNGLVVKHRDDKILSVTQILYRYRELAKRAEKLLNTEGE